MFNFTPRDIVYIQSLCVSLSILMLYELVREEKPGEGKETNIAKGVIITCIFIFFVVPL